MCNHTFKISVSRKEKFSLTFNLIFYSCCESSYGMLIKIHRFLIMLEFSHFDANTTLLFPGQHYLRFEPKLEYTIVFSVTAISMVMYLCLYNFDKLLLAAILSILGSVTLYSHSILSSIPVLICQYRIEHYCKTTPGNTVYPFFKRIFCKYFRVHFFEVVFFLSQDIN